VVSFDDFSCVLFSLTHRDLVGTHHRRQFLLGNDILSRRIEEHSTFHSRRGTSNCWSDDLKPTYSVALNPFFSFFINQIIGMAISPLFFLEKKAISQEEKAPLKDSRTDTPAPESQQEKEDVSKQYVTLGKLSINKRMIGYSAAIFNGIWGGSVMSPMKIANQRGVPTGIE
jgi:hypothetical protein